MTRGLVGWLPAELALIPPGPQLAATLAGVDVSKLDNDDVVRFAQARQRQLAHDDAQLLVALHEVGRRTDALLGGDPNRRAAEAEISYALTWTKNAASNQLVLADDLVERLPAVFAALNSGEIDVPRARVISDLTLRLHTPLARHVVDQIIDEAPRLTTAQLRARLLKLVFAADPDAKAKSTKQALRDRRVEVHPTSDGLADLHGYDLPPHRAAAAMERLTAIARAAKRDGDKRTVRQLRADALLDLLVGDGIAAGSPVTDCPLVDPTEVTPPPTTTNTVATPPYRFSRPDDAPLTDVIDWAGLTEPPDEPDADDTTHPDDADLAALWAAGFDYLPTDRPHQPPSATEPVSPTAQQPTSTPPSPSTPVSGGPMPGPRKGVIDLQVSLTTLLRLNDNPADLAGFGPVIADIARQIVAENTDATWRFSVYDNTGTLTNHGITRRRPTARDAAFIHARDRHCRAPGCRMPARLCEIDHTVPWAQSHNSHRTNLADLCGSDHVVRHLPGSQLTQFGDGILAWRTPLGLCYYTKPPTYFDG